MIPSRAVRFVLILVIVACTAGCDQATKHFARSGLSRMGSTTLAGGFFELTLAENPGGFLSLGASLPNAVRSAVLGFGVSLGLACLMIYLMGASRLGRLAFLGLALIWAGGLSNLIDRFARHGLVTDFMVVRAGPLRTGVFNVADLAIVAGMLLLAFSFRTRRGVGSGLWRG